MELLKQQAAECGAGCACHAGGTPGKARWVVGVIVLIAAGVLVARAVVKNGSETTAKPASGFAVAVAAEKPATNTASTVAAKEIGGLAELNTVAASLDVVFVFLPGKAGAVPNATMTQVQDVARKIETQAGAKIGVFSLKTSAPKYEQIAEPLSLPGVLTLVKGGGMVPVTGEITETKLIQAFARASSAGGCGPRGCN